MDGERHVRHSAIMFSRNMAPKFHRTTSNFVHFQERKERRQIYGQMTGKRIDHISFRLWVMDRGSGSVQCRNEDILDIGYRELDKSILPDHGFRFIFPSTRESTTLSDYIVSPKSKTKHGK